MVFLQSLRGVIMDSTTLSHVKNWNFLVYILKVKGTTFYRMVISVFLLIPRKMYEEDHFYQFFSSSH